MHLFDHKLPTMITSSNSLSRGSGMPNQVHGAFLHAPCPVPSCPACEPNSGSVLASVSTKAYSSRGGRHCYAIMWISANLALSARRTLYTENRQGWRDRLAAL